MPNISDLKPEDVAEIHPMSSSGNLQDLKPEDISEIHPMEKPPSILQSLLRGGVHGALLEKPVAALQAIPQALISNTNLSDQYQKQQQALAQQYQLSQNTNPIATGIGNVGGSVPAMIGTTALTGNPITGAALYGGLSGAQETGTLGGAATGAALGTAAGAVGEKVLSPLLSKGAEKGGDIVGILAKKMSGLKPSQIETYLKDPEKIKQLAKMYETPSESNVIQKQAVGALKKSRQALSEQADTLEKKLYDILGDKEVTISPKQYSGLHDDIDDILNTYKEPTGEFSYESPPSDINNPYPSTQNVKVPNMELPDEINLSAEDANDIKRILQTASKYKPGTVTDPNQLAQIENMSKLATAMKERIEETDPTGTVSDLNEQFQTLTNLKKKLGQFQRNAPESSLTGNSTDKAAALAQAENIAPTGLTNTASQMSVAKSLSDITPGTFKEGIQKGIAKKIIPYTQDLGQTLGQIVGKTASMGTTISAVKAAPAAAATLQIGGSPQQIVAGTKSGEGQKMLDDGFKNMYQATPEKLGDLGSQLINNDSTKYIGQSLLKAVKDGDKAAQNAVVFSILQSPAARKILGLQAGQ